MKVLITGGAGYIGSELARKLILLPEVKEIIIYDNLSRKNYNFFFLNPLPKEKITFIQGDILDSRTFSKVLEGVDIVYHLAANVTTPFASQDPHFFEQINHWGTADVVYAVEQSDVSKLIFTSSTSVYGASNDFIDTDFSPNPKTFYGISKLRAEQQVERLIGKSGVEVFILRCGNVYGFNSSMRFDAVINRFMFEANFQGKISIHGTGTQTRAFISVGALANALKQFTTDTLPPSGIYNVLDQNHSIVEIADTVKDVYPDLEMQFVNQHIPLRELKVKRDQWFEKFITIPHTDLKEALLEFKAAFSF